MRRCQRETPVFAHITAKYGRSPKAGEGRSFPSGTPGAREVAFAGARITPKIRKGKETGSRCVFAQQGVQTQGKENPASGLRPAARGPEE